MENLKLFKSSYIEGLKDQIENGEIINCYLEDDFEVPEAALLVHGNIEVDWSDIELMDPTSDQEANFKNSKTIYELLSDIPPSVASDERLWAYLTHVKFWDYMKRIRGVDIPDKKRKANYIIRHWFVDGASQKKLTRNDIALLWWGAYLTYEENKENPYELTKELWTMKDYTRTLLGGIQGRQSDFTKGFLEFVVENKELFDKYKQDKVRFLMRKADFAAGYKNFRSLSREDIKSFFERYRQDLIDFIPKKT